MTSLQIDRQLVETTARLLLETEPVDVPATLEELGWYDLWADDAENAARVLFGQQGQLARTSPMLSLMMGGKLASAAVGGAGDGDAVAALLPVIAQGAGDGVDWVEDGPTFALAQADALATTSVAVLALSRGGHSEVLRLNVDQLLAVPLAGLDPDLHMCLVDVTRAQADGEVLAEGIDADEYGRQSIALGRRLLAEEMTGLVTAQLQMTVEYAKARTQFGRTIGSYQAVKHKLAETHVAVEIARLAIEDAWRDDHHLAATMAKIHAGDAVEVANRHCLQVLGGIGFTWDHPFHRYYRRGRLLDALLGSAARLPAVVGRSITSTGQVPPITDL